ncbi:MAG: DUF924 family protein [Rhodoferax sp.]
MHPETIIHFWFTELNDAQRFAKDEALDARLRQRFEATLQAAIAGELYEWRRSALGRLAEIVVLDQFSRNIYRDTPAAFSQDAQALALAQELISRGLDQDVPIAQRAFAYMPYMHSESLLIHQQALALFSQTGLEGSLAFEHKHRKILEQFGRYPHRNQILGRASTASEIAFLKTPGSSF